MIASERLIKQSIRNTTLESCMLEAMGETNEEIFDNAMKIYERRIKVLEEVLEWKRQQS